MSMDFLDEFENISGIKKDTDKQKEPEKKKRTTIATPLPRKKKQEEAPKKAPKKVPQKRKPKPSIDTEKLITDIQEKITNNIKQFISNNELEKETKIKLKYEFEKIHNSIKNLNLSKKTKDAINSIYKILEV